LTKEEVYNYILVNTNQYFVGKENFEITDPVLDGLIKRALNIWGDYNPVYVISPVFIDSHKIKLEKIEDNFGITRRILNINEIYFNDYTKNLWPNSKNMLKVPYNWKYDSVKNILYFSAPGEYFYIEALCTPELEDINSNETLFLELMLGLALIYIGHNRTDFALSELPFDIRDLRDEGEQLVEKVLDELKGVTNDGWGKVIDALS